MKKLTIKSVFALAFSFITTATIACDLSGLTLNSVIALGGNRYRIEVNMCAGAGTNGSQYGAMANTYHYSFHFSGITTLDSYNPSVTSPQTGAVYNSVIVEPNLVLGYAPDITGEWWARIDQGPITSYCTVFVFETTGLPDSIRVMSIEGGGNPAAGCLGSEMLILLTPVVNAGNDANVYYGYAPAECTQLTATVTGGIAPFVYQWSSGQSTASINVCPLATTNYTVTVTDALGCQRTDVVTVNVQDVRCGSRLNNVHICHSGVTKCVKNSQVAGHIGHGDQLGQCGGSKTEEFVHDDIEAGEDLAVFPNPSASDFHIAFVPVEDQESELAIFDIQGKKIETVFAGEVIGGQHYEFEFDGTSHPAGMYIARLSSANEAPQTVRLVISR